MRQRLIDAVARAGRRARHGLRRALGDPTLRPPPEVTERRRVAQADVPLRVGVIGTGRIAAAHLAVLSSFEDVAVVGLANRRSDASGLAERFGIAATYRGAEALLDDARPDVAYVLVGVQAIPQVAREVLDRGVPCLIEKPAALTAAGVADLAERAAAARIPHLVGLNRRFHSVLDHALDAVRAHGRLVGVHVEVHEPIASLRARSAHAPAVLDRWLAANSVHMIDLLRRCGGEVEDLSAVGHGAGAARDGFGACLRFGSGAVGTFAGHWRSVPGVRLVLFGEGVRAELEPLERGTLVFADGRRQPLPIDRVDRRFKPGFYAQSAALLDAVCRGEPVAPPASDLADQVRTMKLVEQIAGAAEEAL